MIIPLRILFGGILAAMLGITAWASADTALWDLPRGIGTHPWFLATLADAYFGFVTFWVWVAWRERRWTARIGWLIAILLLGNIAMATYLLRALFRLPADAPLEQLLARRPSVGNPS